MSQCEVLESSVTALVVLLSQHGIELPPDFSFETTPISSPDPRLHAAQRRATGATVKRNLLVHEVDDALAVPWSVPSPLTAYPSPEEPMLSPTRPCPPDSEPKDHTLDKNHGTYLGRSAGLNELGSPTVGIEFVLK